MLVFSCLRPHPFSKESWTCMKTVHLVKAAAYHQICQIHMCFTIQCSLQMNSSLLDDMNPNNMTSRDQQSKPEEALVTEFVFEVILLSVISFFGFLGNVGAIVLFTTMKRQLKFHRLMMMLSAFDLIYVALSFMLFALPRVSHDEKLFINPNFSKHS